MLISVLRRRCRDDDGFGLIETIVALLIAGVVFGALATTLIASVQASLFGRQNQQATDMMTAQLERTRTLGYLEVAMRSSDLAGDARLVNCASTKCLDVDGTMEPVVVGTAGSVFPHTETVADVTTNQTAFTVSTYVTELADQPLDRARRVSVFISWSTKGTVHTRSTSSIIAYSQSGLPLPVFKLGATPAAITVNPGATVTYDVTLLNQGAPDRWNLTLSGATTGWSWFADTDKDGDLSAGDAALTDTTLDGIVDTGRVDPATTSTFFLTRTVPVLEVVGVKPTTITATSVGQPSAGGATASVTVTTTIVLGVVTPSPTPTPTPTGTPPPVAPTCPAVVAGAVVTGVGTGGYTVRQFTLHNNGVGASVAQAQMAMDLTAVDEPSLATYSTDIDAATAGRVLTSSGASLPAAATIVSSSSTATVADWQRTMPSKSWIDGTGVVRLWFAGHGATAATSARIVLYSAASPSAAKSVLKSVDVTLVPGCAGFQEVYATLPDADGALVAKNGVLGIRIAVAGGEATLGYDVAEMPASFTIGVK